jgi:quinoprotein glucose dehydrogenase
MPTVHESDICIIGGGISAALFAQKMSELRPGIRIVVVEAGKTIFDSENRMEYRRRRTEYNENPWQGDYIPDQSAVGIISRTMAVGGSALHWGGACNRFSEEDLRLKSMYGLAVDWPLEWMELERYYCEAERRMGVSGEPGPFPEDARSEPYPMHPMPLTYNLRVLKEHSEKSGIPFHGTPMAKNTRPYDGRNECIRCKTCAICPTGARYSPDFTYKKLLSAGKLTLHDQTLVRRLVMDDKSARIVAAQAMDRLDPSKQLEYRARHFVLASGYTWSPHLLLLSANDKFPNGLANKSGCVGRYMTGHGWVTAQMEVPHAIYPGMNETYALISRQFFRCDPGRTFMRHDLRIWESGVNREPQLKDKQGNILLGDDLLKEWRSRATSKGTARLRSYFDTHPDRDSRLTLDASNRNAFGDPMPKIEHRMDAAAQGRLPATRQHIVEVFERLAKANNGRLLRVTDGPYQDHPAGGCRMGASPADSVTDSYGRTHDHENLFVVGAPTLPTGGCTNGTLTFVAMTLRSADKLAAEYQRASSTRKY